MAQTSDGAKKAAATRRKNYTPQQISDIKRRGGEARTPGGFGYLKKNDPERFKQIIKDREARKAARKAAAK